jgi:hypothetical protein
MISFFKLSVGIALALAATGQLKSATLKMAAMAIETQTHQMSYSKFSRELTGPRLPAYKSGLLGHRKSGDVNAPTN